MFDTTTAEAEAIDSYNQIDGVEASSSVFDGEILVQVEDQSIGKFWGQTRRSENVEARETGRITVSNVYDLVSWVKVE